MPTFLVLRPDLQNLPPKAKIIERYPNFVVVSAPAEEARAMRAKWPTHELKAPPRVNTPVPRFLRNVVALPQTRAIVVRFRAPVRREWRQEIEQHSRGPVYALARSSLLVPTATDALIRALRALPYVERIDPYTPSFRLRPAVVQKPRIVLSREDLTRSQATLARRERRRFRPRALSVPGLIVADFFSAAHARAATQTLRRTVAITAQHGTRLTLNLAGLEDPLAGVALISRQLGLRSVSERSLFVPFNNVARGLIGAGLTIALENGDLELTGENETIAIADSGLDTGDAANLHEDFRGRLTAMTSFPIAPSFSGLINNDGDDDGPADLSGHGTAVAGCAAGDGSASAELDISIRGTAPKARLFIQAMEQRPEWTMEGELLWLQQGLSAPPKGLFGVPETLSDLFEPAYEAGARIHSNSWGSGTPGDYDDNCRDVDEFVWNHPNFLIVFAAGNGGRNSEDGGEIEEMSVAPPGTAKNCLTVGASENPRYPQFKQTYGAVFPNEFPFTPLSKSKMTNKVTDVAAFSARGPCATGRQKPDLIAPGTFILSTKSSIRENAEMEWAPFPDAEDNYLYLGGTSMATPIVAGAAALVRQYLREVEAIADPTAALMKAVLIHSAEVHPANAVHRSDNSQGWGRIDLRRVFAPKSPESALFIDEEKALETGESQTYELDVHKGTPLRVTLVYTDPPGEHLINNLNLIVHPPAGKILRGNDFDKTDEPDETNNVEGVKVKNPAEGLWTVEVVATEVLDGPQPYALVISGNLTLRD